MIAFFKSRHKTEIKVVAAKPKPSPKKAFEPVDKNGYLRLRQLRSFGFRKAKISYSCLDGSEVYLKLKSDGSVIYDGILKKGSSERWEARESFESTE